jgi:hypothetical protein
MLKCQKSLEQMHAEKMSQFAGSRSDAGEMSRAEIDYLLDAAPIFQDYATQTTQPDQSVENENEMTESYIDGTIRSFVQVETATKKSAHILKLRLVVAASNDSNEGHLAARSLQSLEAVNVNECPDCHTSLRLISEESLLVCPDCGMTAFNMDSANGIGLTYEQEINRVVIPAFAYKRQNHLSEWISQFQGKESTDIPDEVVDGLRAEFKKARISSTNEITAPKVRALLKKLNFSKFYEHVPHIMKILGVMPPQMSSDLEDKIRQMFLQCQEPFRKHCPSWRKNMMSYSFLLHKFCQLLGEDEYLPSFTLLKSRGKLKLHDQIWSKMCADLDWEFIPTI